MKRVGNGWNNYHEKGIHVMGGDEIESIPSALEDEGVEVEA